MRCKSMTRSVERSIPPAGKNTGVEEVYRLDRASKLYSGARVMSTRVP